LNPISTVIIALNEEERLEGCVRPCLAFSDEVVVVDCGSRDGTRAVAERLGCRVIDHPWPGYGPQRNLGAEHATHDWIFSVDPDETPDDVLVQAIADAPADGAVAYSVRRVNEFLGEPLTHGSEVKVRLYDRRRARFTDRPVHEVVTVPAAETSELPGVLFHQHPATLADELGRLYLYTSLEADLAVATRGPRLWRLLLRPPLRFGHRYVLQGGILHGWRGFLHACYWAYWELVREVKVYRRRRRCASSS
jgi:glycosyltransferase involved in cell wall biosynthesis